MIYLDTLTMGQLFSMTMGALHTMGLEDPGLDPVTPAKRAFLLLIP